MVYIDRGNGEFDELSIAGVSQINNINTHIKDNRAFSGFFIKIDNVVYSNWSSEFCKAITREVTWAKLKAKHNDNV